MNSKLLKLKKEINKFKPSKEDKQGALLQELLSDTRQGKKTFKEFIEGISKVL